MLTLSIQKLSDHIAHCLWTREPFRHFKIESSITKNDGGDTPDVSYDILIPEAAIFNLSGDTWNPVCKRLVEDTVYDAWQTEGYVGGLYAGPDGVMLRSAPGPGIDLTEAGSGLARNRLAVNLKATVSSIDVRWRVLQHARPINEGSVRFDFTDRTGTL